MQKRGTDRLWSDTHTRWTNWTGLNCSMAHNELVELQHRDLGAAPKMRPERERERLSGALRSLALSVLLSHGVVVAAGDSQEKGSNFWMKLNVIVFFLE